MKKRSGNNELLKCLVDWGWGGGLDPLFSELQHLSFFLLRYKINPPLKKRKKSWPIQSESHCSQGERRSGVEEDLSNSATNFFFPSECTSRRRHVLKEEMLLKILCVFFLPGLLFELVRDVGLVDVCLLQACKQRDKERGERREEREWWACQQKKK